MIKGVRRDEIVDLLGDPTSTEGTIIKYGIGSWSFSPGGYDDTFEILPLATQIYDSTQSFLTTVTTDDVVDNTTDGVTGTILSIVDNFRITTSSAVMFGDTDGVRSMIGTSSPP